MKEYPLMRFLDEYWSRFCSVRIQARPIGLAGCQLFSCVVNRHPFQLPCTEWVRRSVTDGDGFVVDRRTHLLAPWEDVPENKGGGFAEFRVRGVLRENRRTNEREDEAGSGPG